MTKRLMAALILAACLLGVYLLFALPPKQETGNEANAPFTVPDTPIDDAAAQKIYKTSCISCHGVDLEGGVGPSLVKVGSDMTKEQIYKQIERGGGGMPKFEGVLSEQELIVVTNWLASKK